MEPLLAIHPAQVTRSVDVDCRPLRWSDTALPVERGSCCVNPGRSDYPRKNHPNTSSCPRRLYSERTDTMGRNVCGLACVGIRRHLPLVYFLFLPCHSFTNSLPFVLFMLRLNPHNPSSTSLLYSTHHCNSLCKVSSRRSLSFPSMPFPSTLKYTHLPRW